MSEYYQFRDETGTPIDYYELVNDNNELSKENEQLQNQLQQKKNIIKEVKSQLDYLETYSSKEDVYEDMSRRLNRIEKIIGDNSNE